MNRFDIENIEPKEIFSWFKKICEIPHGSYHEQKISDWLTKTFRQLGCKTIQYPSGMILVKLDATKGHEKQPTLLLQAHMDMVLVKTDDCPKDLLKDKIDPYYDSRKDIVTADKTSLGADNGIAIASMLAIAEDKSIPHGPLELLITVNEEVLPGECIAKDLKAKDIKSTSYINLDGVGVPTLIYGAAGGVIARYNNPLKYQKCNSSSTFHIVITGLKGGHSGVEIHKPHINAISWLAEGLLNFSKKEKVDINVVTFNGGPISNAIPVYAECDIQINQKFISKLEKNLKEYLNLAKIVAQENEKAASIKITKLKKPVDHMLSTADSIRLLSTVACCPNKLFTLEQKIGCMYSSSNIGFIEVNDKKKTFIVDYKIRSFFDGEVDRLILMFKNYMESFGWPKFEVLGRCWSFVNNPNLNTAAIAWSKAYRKIVGKPISQELCPAGLELTDVCRKKPSLTSHAICVGPTILNEHSPDEFVSVSDLKIYWDILKQTLKEIK